MYYFGILTGALLVNPALAHMQLHYPAPFNASNNPHRTTGADPYLQYPYDCCGPNDRWEYPCRGYLDLLGTPEGAPTATWEAGSTQIWNIEGIGNHYGGSCQVGFSIDKGDSFHVATSYEGNCPHRNGGLGPDGQDFDFMVPRDLPVGVQVFAWIWYNREQEFNMNCAAVNITAQISTASSTSAATSSTSATTSQPSRTISTSTACSAPALAEAAKAPSPSWASQGTATFQPSGPPTPGTASRSRGGPMHPRDLRRRVSDNSTSASSVPFLARPLMLIADDGNGCLTPKTTAELKYPDPGPDVVPGDGEYPLQLPSGRCNGPGEQSYHGVTGNDGHPSART